MARHSRDQTSANSSQESSNHCKPHDTTTANQSGVNGALCCESHDNDAVEQSDGSELSDVSDSILSPAVRSQSSFIELDELMVTGSAAVTTATPPTAIMKRHRCIDSPPSSSG